MKSYMIGKLRLSKKVITIGDDYANTQTQMLMTKFTNTNLKSIKTLSCYMFLEETI